MAESGDRFVLYHHTRDGRVPVVDFTRTGDTWRVTVRDTPYKASLEGELLPSIGLYRLRRAVKPEEGDLYLQALQQTFSHTSAWELIPADADRPC
jgi:hypothetical protein